MTILSLTVSNIVLIEKLSIDFAKGLCVLTGETGAGKSILLDCLGLALGERSESGLVRGGQSQGSVVAEFDISKLQNIQERLDEFGITKNNPLILKRIINSDGKSRAFINDEAVSVNTLKDIGSMLVEIHGQHDQKGLLNQQTHIHMLDEFGSLSEHSKEVRKLWREWKSFEKKLQDEIEALEKAKRDEEYLRYVAKEIEDLAPEKGEENSLAEERIEIQNAMKSAEVIDSTLKILSPNKSVLDLISQAERELIRGSSKTNPEQFSKILEHLEKSSIELNEAIAELEAMNDDNINNISEQRLEKIEDRLFTLRAIARKYGISVDELKDYGDKIREQIGLIETSESNQAALNEQVKKARDLYIKKAFELSEQRRNFAVKLEKKVMDELEPLKLGRTVFEVAIVKKDESEWTENGIDDIAFLAATNPGANPSSIAKIASGGELSRFMLALKVALSEVKSVPTVIFDEIDTGIGGAVADAVGARLAKLGNIIQVLVVTHQPQVAARAKHHLLISKKMNADSAITSVEVLGSDKQQEELARMLSGSEITPEARAAAARLLLSA